MHKAEQPVVSDLFPEDPVPGTYTVRATLANDKTTGRTRGRDGQAVKLWTGKAINECSAIILEDASDRAPSSTMDPADVPPKVNPRATHARALPSGDSGTIVGEGDWLYAWPHDLLPDSVAGFQVESTPVDNSLANRGKTKSNWAAPAVYATRSGKRVTVWCKKDYREGSGSWVPEVRSVCYESTAFHKLKAGFGSPDSAPGTIVLEDNTSIRGYRPVFKGEAYMTFRMSDIVFELFTENNDEAEAKKLLLDIAEAIYQKNLSKLEQTPTPQETAPR